MTSDNVNRSRVFREPFLPGAYTRLRNQAYAKIMGVRSSSQALEGIDREQLSDALQTYISDWEVAGGAVDEALRIAAERRLIEIQSPTELFIAPDPLMLVCKKCYVVDFYDLKKSDKLLMELIHSRIAYRKGRKVILCKRNECDGFMLQLPYVAIHRCGISKPIFLHPAARRSSKNIGFKDNGNFLQSLFFDVDTKKNLSRALQDDCPNCSSKAGAGGKLLTDINMRGTPITNGEAFYTQTTQFIAMSESRGKLIAQAMGVINSTRGSLIGMAADIADGVASVLLRRVTGIELEQQFSAMFSEKNNDVESIAAAEKKLAEKLAARVKVLQSDIPPEFVASIVDALDKEIEQLKKIVKGKSGHFSGVRAAIPHDSILVDLVSQRRSFESVLLEQDVSALSIDEAIQQSTDSIQRETLAKQWSKIQNDYGISSINHIPDLRVVLAALGFTREKSAPKANPEAPPVLLNGFSDQMDDALRGRTPVYAMSAKTEALWIRLDPIKVLKWCVDAAGWPSPTAEILVSRELSHGYLLQYCQALTMNPGRVSKDTILSPPLESAPFHLLHTICHTLMHTARRHTGYDAKSIVEYLLPMDLSFLIYVSSVQNYTAGGLLTLFNHYLQPWFDDASMFAFNCAFDPICSDVGGSCSGCVQIDIACETFNAGLSRAYLHGGTIDREGDHLVNRGFWDGE